MRGVGLILIVMFIMGGCLGYGYATSPTLKETDLVGTWQAVYGGTATDTLTLRSDGTYQQVFQSSQINYFYRSPWNEWYVERSPRGNLSLHLKGMRYFASGIELGESGGRDWRDEDSPFPFYNADEDKIIEMIDKVILRIKSDKGSPDSTVLLQMQVDPDNGPERFILKQKND